MLVHSLGKKDLQFIEFQNFSSMKALTKNGRNFSQQGKIVHQENLFELKHSYDRIQIK